MPDFLGGAVFESHCIYHEKYEKAVSSESCINPACVYLQIKIVLVVERFEASYFDRINMTENWLE